MQKALWFCPKNDTPVPLLVALHTWSSGFAQKGGEVLYADWCLQEGWAFIHPDFRGANKTPESCGSDLVVSDVMDAVEFAKSNAKIDPKRIYLVGVSGGGHGSMLLAARTPPIWAGVSAWCGITDLEAWHRECDGTEHERYARFMESACGGPPSNPEAKKQYTHRSPLTWLEKAELKVNLDLSHGLRDGRTGSVPFTHSMHAFNAVAAGGDRFHQEEITEFYETLNPPEEQDFAHFDQWDRRQPVFRRVSGNTRLTIFNGGHEMVHEAALNWLAQQRLGEPAVWDLDPKLIRDLPRAELAIKSGK